MSRSPQYYAYINSDEWREKCKKCHALTKQHCVVFPWAKSQNVIEKMVVYGGNAGIIGLCTISAAAISQAALDKLREVKVEQIVAALETKHHCDGCKYYFANSYLSCAVNPDLPKNCSYFTCD